MSAAEKVTLCPRLWRNLPDDLIGLVFKKLPLIDLIGVRTLNKEWKTRVSSSEFRIPPGNFCPSHSTLVIQVGMNLVLYRSKSSSWDNKSLWDVFQSSSSVFLDPRITQSRLELIASDGGFLCFSSRYYRNLFVCNPITKQFIHLKLSCTRLEACSPTPKDPGLTESNVNISSSRRPRSARTRCGNVRAIGGLRVDSHTGHFRLLISILHDDDLVRTNIYNSESRSWNQVNDITFPRVQLNVRRRFSIKTRPRLCNNSCVFQRDCFYTIMQPINICWELFKFDIRRESWSKVPLRKRIAFHIQLGLFQGNLLLLETEWYSRYRFFMIREADGEVTSWISVLEPLSQQLGTIVMDMHEEFRQMYILSCITTGGDNIYFLNDLKKVKLVNNSTCDARKSKLFVYNLQTQLLTFVEVGKKVMDLNLRESRWTAYTPSLVLLAS